MFYLALIGDFCSSPELHATEEVRHSLQPTLLQANSIFRDALASPSSVTPDGQIQALFINPEPIWAFITGLQASLRPTDLRFGLGVGSLDTPINPNVALDMEGPAFQRARDALSKLREDGGFYRINGISNATLTNASLTLIAQLQRTWNDNRFTVYHDYLREAPVPQTAATLGISKAAIYKNIHDGFLQDLAKIQQAASGHMLAAMLV
ncbi:MAG: SatD family protein [Congregibacter sp.]